MPLYPRPLEQRFPAELQAMQLRLSRLETRTAGIDSGWPLAALPAVIDPAYTTGQPKAFLNGATTLTGPYQRLSSYTPTAGDHVLAVPVGAQQTYVILGKLI
ncbi:hypothetical protein ACIRVF_08375 [Kitasatospora sp. NPDC101157]|uniref:hypothetical protein n=1 Tax=Kitasatospora sp. NPDC101157 TaxID=3364098 RepID=UPI0037FCFCD9